MAFLAALSSTSREPLIEQCPSCNRIIYFASTTEASKVG